ncbi:MAG: ATP-binding cassette domain-containing protein [Anaerolineales bacterium]
MSVRTSVIIAQGLTRHFEETVAVEDLTLEVEQGEIFGFLGHNGAGKTTTVRLLNGVLAPTKGSARVLGFDPVTEGADLRRHTGVLTETPSLDERLTGRENLSIFADLFGVPQERVGERVAELLERFVLTERADDPVGEYSKGMKQRLAIARALLHEPELLFLDEPTAGLDPVATRQVHRLISELSQQGGRSVFLCTHNLNEAQKLCHRVGVMERGRLVALGTPTDLARELTTRPRLEIEVAPDAVERARSILDRLAPAHEVIVEDKGLLTATVGDREQVPVLLTALVNGGISVYRLSPQEPTLEDVYFALHPEEERG